MPGFWLALLLMLYTGLEHQWLPISGLMSLDYESLSFWGKLMDPGQAPCFAHYRHHSGKRRRHVPLHAVIHAGSLAAGLHSYGQGQRTAARVVIFRHALRNALLPVITLLGLSVPGLIGGSVIIETIFALPGLGQLFYAAVMARDYPLIMGNLVLGAVLTLAGNMLADIGYGLADPRIRAQGKRQ